MKKLTEQGKRALQYIQNTGGSVSKEAFYDDHEPIGPLLRKDIDDYIDYNMETKKLSLNKAGKEAIK